MWHCEEYWQHNSTFGHRQGITVIAHNAFAVAQAQLDEVSRLIGLDKTTHELLRCPQWESAARLPVKIDDGLIQVLLAFRV